MPERVNAEESTRTPIKKAMIGLPNPSMMICLNPSIPKTGIRSMMRSAVILKGITSVIHRTTAATSRAMMAFAFQERGTSSPPLSKGSGDGRSMITAIRTKANKKNPILYVKERGSFCSTPPPPVLVSGPFPRSMSLIPFPNVMHS